MVGMRVREHDRSRRDVVDAMQPVRSAIDHNSVFTAPNQQRAVSSVPVRMELDPSPRAEKG